ncbi:MAG TPA: hypothetical protein PK563_00780 [Tenuifilaceae bacterium]|nr:hypothetical protein [Tenuifilaceae bacterium]
MNAFKVFFFIIGLQCIASHSFSQNWNSIYAKEIEAEYLIVEGQFEKAADKYLDALKQIPNSANLSFKVGYTFLLCDEKKNDAIIYLEDASKQVSADYDPRSIKETNAPPETHYFLGKAYQIAGRFTEAIAAFKKYEGFIDPSHENWNLVDQQIKSCSRAKAEYNEPVPYKKSNLGELINNDKPNFNAVISGDGQTLAYTSIGNLGYDIFVSKFENGAWSKPRKITSQLNENFFNTVSLSFDGTELYLVDVFSPERTIFSSVLQGKKWGKAKKLPKPINQKKYSQTHASISADNQTLYFTSDRPGGFGGLDIYKSTRDSKGKWGKPTNLGSSVNTPLNDEFPFETSDGKYLFFSSQGHNSMGGFDVFYTETSNLPTPQNAGYPINNSDDNFFSPTDMQSGFMALFDENSFGKRDLYQVNLYPWVKFTANVKFPPSISNGANVSLREIIEDEIIINTTINPNDPPISKKIKPGNYEFQVTGDGFEVFTEILEIPEEPKTKEYPLFATLKEITSPPVLLAEEVSPETPEMEEPVTIEEEETEIEEPEEIVSKTEVEEINTVPEESPIQNSEETQQPIVSPPTKDTPKKQFASAATDGYEGFFTIQVMALIIPVQAEHFSNINDISVTKGSDGIHRYTTGMFSSKEEAIAFLNEVRSKGYNDAFVRRVNPVEATPAASCFTIQLMALKNPVEIEYFNSQLAVEVLEGSDEFHRYITGNYQTKEDALSELAKVIELGYKDAFIRKR